MRGLSLYPMRQFGWDGFSFYLYERFENGSTAYGVSVTMQTFENLSVEPSQPTFHLKHEQAQRLMDELWNCGLRPSEGTGSAGALAAVEKHLAAEMEIRRQLLSKVLEK